MEVVKAVGLTKTFKQTIAINDFDLSVGEGEIVGLVGPDGAGKTTIMRLLASILEPTTGDAWVLGRHVVKEAESVKEVIGYMSQRFGLYPDLTVLENMEFYADIYGVPGKERAAKLEKLLNFSNLAPFKKRLADNLSGGMKQKLGLACALIHTPKVLFLDEPTCGVDPVSRRDFWRILYELLREKVTILITTSYMDEAERCGRVGFLHHGKLICSGTPDEIKKQMNKSILEIRTEIPRQAMTVLRKNIENLEAWLIGSRIRVPAGDPEATCRHIENILRGSSISNFTIKQSEPNLEDVFISMLSSGQNGAAHGP